MKRVHLPVKDEAGENPAQKLPPSNEETQRHSSGGLLTGKVC